jgi:hypothetical protein
VVKSGELGSCNGIELAAQGPIFIRTPAHLAEIPGREPGLVRLQVIKMSLVSSTISMIMLSPNRAVSCRR